MPRTKQLQADFNCTALLDMCHPFTFILAYLNLKKKKCLNLKFQMKLEFWHCLHRANKHKSETGCFLRCFCTSLRRFPPVQEEGSSVHYLCGTFNWLRTISFGCLKEGWAICVTRKELWAKWHPSWKPENNCQQAKRKPLYFYPALKQKKSWIPPPAQRSPISSCWSSCSEMVVALSTWLQLFRGRGVEERGRGS